jgi:D-alanyl-D-alanine carboxypeptidase
MIAAIEVEPGPPRRVRAEAVSTRTDAERRFRVVRDKQKTARAGRTAGNRASSEAWRSRESTKIARVLLDGSTGRLILRQHGDVIYQPASLVKLMALYLVFEALAEGRLKAKELLVVSRAAAQMKGSRLGLREGMRVMLADIVKGIVIRSGNDATQVIVERMGGVHAFVAEMNYKAGLLRLGSTRFLSPSGFTQHLAQRASAVDMARLAYRLYRDFPDRRALFCARSMAFGGASLANTNALLSTYEGLTGLKTGSCPGMYHLAAAAVRNNHELIGVVMNCPSPRDRDLEMTRLLDQGFEHFGKPAVRARSLLRKGAKAIRVAPAVALSAVGVRPRKIVR